MTHDDVKMKSSRLRAINIYEYVQNMAHVCRKSNDKVKFSGIFFQAPPARDNRRNKLRSPSCGGGATGGATVAVGGEKQPD